MTATIKQYEKRKQHLIDLLGGSCVECGATENLEFDHIDRLQKSFVITSKWTMALDKLLAELEKCQLLCHDCHEKKTRSEIGSAQHGTISMYRHHRCRCEPCRMAYNEASRRWKLAAKNRK